METIAELIQRVKKVKVIECYRPEVTTAYENARQGSVKFYELYNGSYLPNWVVSRLRHFPRDASVEFAPSTYLDGMDMLITWPTKRRVSRYRLHMIPAYALNPR